MIELLAAMQSVRKYAISSCVCQSFKFNVLYEKICHFDEIPIVLVPRDIKIYDLI